MYWVEQFFYQYGRVIGRWPLPFVLVPTILTIVSTYGLTKFREATDVWALFSPTDAPSHLEKQKLLNYSLVSGNGYYQLRIIIRSRNYYQKLHQQLPPTANPVPTIKPKSLFISTNAQNHTADDGNLLTLTSMQEISAFNAYIESNMSAKIDGRRFSYGDVCGQLCRFRNGPILRLLTKFVKEPENPNLRIHYPVASVLSSHKLYLGDHLGGLTLTPRGRVDAFRMMFLKYYVREVDTKRGRALRDTIEQKISRYIRLQNNYSRNGLQYDLFTPNLDVIEQRNVPIQTLPYLGGTVLVLGGFAMLTLFKLHPFRHSQHFEALFGMISPGMAFLTTNGLLWYLGYPFTNILTVVPFLVLVIGIDDAFLILAGWRLTAESDPVDVRLGHALRKSGTSVTVTSLTDVLCFSIGTSSSMEAVRLFCLYTATALAFDFLYQITFFAAIVAYGGRREHVAYQKLLLDQSLEESVAATTEKSVPKSSPKQFHVAINNNDHCHRRKRRNFFSQFGQLYTTNQHPSAQMHKATAPRSSLKAQLPTLEPVIIAKRTVNPDTAGHLQNRSTSTGISRRSNNDNNKRNFNGALPVNIHQKQHVVPIISANKKRNLIVRGNAVVNSSTENGVVTKFISHHSHPAQKRNNSSSSPSSSSAFLYASSAASDSASTSSASDDSELTSTGSSTTSSNLGSSAGPDKYDRVSRAFVTSKTLRIAAFFLYFVHVAVSCWRCAQIPSHFSLRKLYLHSSPLTALTQDLEDFIFQEAYTVAYVCPFPKLSDYQTRQNFLGLVHELETIPHYSTGPPGTQLWLRDYQPYAELVASSRSAARAHDIWEPYRILHNWINALKYPDYWFLSNRKGVGVGVGDSKGGVEHIQSFFWTSTYRNISGFTGVRQLIAKRRHILNRYPEFQVTSFHSLDVPADIITYVPEKLMKTMGVAVASMALLVLIFVANLEATFWVILSLFSICSGTIGYLGLWEVHLDGVSLVSILMSVGISVDFSAHICYHFFTADRHKNEDENGWAMPCSKQYQTQDIERRVADTLRAAGWPILQAILSSILGMLVLVPIDAYVVKVFWKTVILVNVLGCFQSLILLPSAFITFYGHNRKDNRKHRFHARTDVLIDKS